MGITILIIFVLAIVGAIVWFFLKNKKEPSVQPEKPSEPISQPSNPPIEEAPTNEEKDPEPRFNIGDIIQFIGDYEVFPKIFLISEIAHGQYWDKTGCVVPISTQDDWELVKDQENPKYNDGDVLVCGKYKRPFIFKGFLDKFHPENPVAYCGIDYNGDFVISSGDGWWTNDFIEPATDDSINYLFKKMHEAGYEWNAESKELKKIDQQDPIIEEPEPQKPKSELLYKVGLISDMHYDVADSKKSEYAEDITNALKYFKQQGVDFIASCGDFAQYDFKDFEGFYKLYMKNVSDIRLYTCLGNHDYLLMYDEHSTMSESDRQMAWQNTIADLHCRTDVMDRKSSEAENDIHFFEYDAPWDAPKGTGTRSIKSKLNYWIERHGDIYVFLSVDYGKDPIPQLWGTMANAVNLLDKNDKYVKQMKEYVNDTSYNEKLEEKFDYQFYHPNTMIWLKDIIEANKDKNVFVFTHHYLTHKAGGNTPSNGKWFYSQMRVWPYTSDERIRQRYYSGANSLCGIEFHFINKLNNLYKNVTWFSGHTHIKWDNIKYDEYLAFCDKEFDIVKPDGKETVPLVDDIWQYANGKYDYRRYTRKSENPTGDCGMNVHLPSLSKPIDITTGHGTTIYGASEGAIMEVWNDKVVINGITFKSSGSKYESTVVCSKTI